MTAQGVLVRDVEDGPAMALVAQGGSARALVWPGIGAELRSLHAIRLEPGGRTVELRHPSDAVYYVAAGSGVVAEPGGASVSLSTGAMFHVDAGTTYTAIAGDGGMELLGGPAPADPALYENVREG